MFGTTTGDILATGPIPSKSPLRARMVLLSLGFIAIVAMVTWGITSHSQNRVIEFKALKIAEIVASQAASARSVYAELAASKLSLDGFGASAESEDRPGHVPLPSQFLKQLSERSSQDPNKLFTFKPISQWNLDEAQGLEDEFQRWAWSELEKQDVKSPAKPIQWTPVWRIDEVDGVSTLRYLRADPANTESCVNCHNALERRPETMARRVAAGVTPGHQFQRNELLGAIEINIPLQRAAALAHEQTQQGLLIVIAVMIIGLAGVCFLVYVDASRTRSMTAQLAQQANHDSLTGLPNRLSFDSTLASLLTSEGLSDQQHAVLLLDLDNFKQINDTLGHEAGDHVLQMTAKRLSSVLRDSDFVARLGGDEFAVLLPATDRHQAEEVSQRIAQAIDSEYAIGEYRLTSGASIGIAMTPDHGAGAMELLRCADVAMYAAKNSHSSFCYYNEQDDDNHVSRLALINDLRQAVREQSLTLHYQPKYSLDEQRMVGVEALLRWNHPVHGNVSPDRIIPIAERCGLIGELTEWLLNESLNACRRLRDAGFDLSVSVNLSATNLHDMDLVTQVSEALLANELAPDVLILEVTESAMMLDPARAEQVLREIEHRGVRVSVDDYGTGYCSLSYLNRLPVQELKLDRSFLLNLLAGEKEAVIVDATLQLAHKLGLTMVAEGVEDGASLDYLASIGCDLVQGYFLCKPLPFEELALEMPRLHHLPLLQPQTTCHLSLA